MNKVSFKVNGIRCGKGGRFVGLATIERADNAVCSIGNGFKMNSNVFSNPIGRNMPCCIIVKGTGRLIIGENVGISSTAIICSHSIKIGNNVKIGGNTVIYDSDFHSLSSKARISATLDRQDIKAAPVLIGDNVFIGAHSTILKGSTIGANSIIGAASVLSGAVPENEIWAGNPARFIRKV